MKSKIFKYILYLGLILTLVIGIVGSIGVCYLINKNYKELPNVAELVENYNPAIPATILDRNGQVIDVLSKEIREQVDIDEIPKNIQNAFMAIEDSSFKTHYGINPKRLIGAMVANFKSGRAVQGGSTITQQLAKNAFLSRDRKLSRKIKELIITFEIERRHTKDEIMEKYLNEIYFGSGAHGVKIASNSFFRKNITDINLAEAAMLAGVPNRPSLYNPRLNLEQSLFRQKLVLNQMVRFGFISKDEEKEALKQKFIKEADATAKDYKDEKTTIIYNRYDKKIEFNAPDFTDLVEKFLIKNFTEAQIYSDGLIINTTLDLNIQKIAKKEFDNYVEFKEKKGLQGAMVTLDSKNGEVISIIGGYNFKTGNFNRATQAKRQYGSAFKPFIYLSAFMNGVEENEIIDDSRTHYKQWAPRNSSGIYYNGITVLQAFDKSQNIVSIKLLERVGTEYLEDLIKKIGVSFNVPTNDLSVALGTAEGTPLQLAQSYAVFSNGGYSVEPIFIKKIMNKYGKVLYEAVPKIEKQFESEDIALVTNLMRSSVKSGTSNPAEVIINDTRIEQGGKTGTTNKSRTVWYSGITPEYITTIYIGYDDNSPIKKATGGKTAAPLWKNFYQSIIEKGYYTPMTYTFIDNHLKNGDLILQKLDPFTGLIKETEGNKEFFVRQGKVVAETSEKYAHGIAGVLGYYVDEEEAEEDEASGKHEVLESPSDNEKNKSNKQLNEIMRKAEKNDKKSKKGILQKIFKFF